MFHPDILHSHTILLDGGIGTLLMRSGLTEDETRGERFVRHPYPLSGNLDILNMTQPDVIARIHRQYLESGAEIIETNTVNANRISQRKYDTASFVGEINRRGAEITRRECRDYIKQHPDRICFVAGALGPTDIYPSKNTDEIERKRIYAELEDAYTEQAIALIEGEVDILLVETIFDSLSARAAIEGICRANRQLETDMRFMLSFTPAEKSARIASGETPEELIGLFERYNPAAIGFNCISPSEKSASLVRRLSSLSDIPVIFYPSAGIPDKKGLYPYSVSDYLQTMKPLLEDGIVRIAGGCCGTTPEYISELRRQLSKSQSFQSI